MTLCDNGMKYGAALGRGILTSGVLAVTLVLQAQESQTSSAREHPLGKGDTTSCIQEAAQMNMGVIKIAQLAAEKAQSPEIKSFSKQLEKDHQKAQDQLESIAKKHDVTLPTSLNQKCQDELSKMKSLSGDEFDKEFAKGAVQGHAMALAKLREASVQEKDQDMAGYIKDMLAKVKEHQVKAREIARSEGLDQTTIASLETQRPEGVGSSGSSTQTDGNASGSNKSDDQNEHREHKDSAPQP
jgi:putative membrane protein